MCPVEACAAGDASGRDRGELALFLRESVRAGQQESRREPCPRGCGRNEGRSYVIPPNGDGLLTAGSPRQTNRPLYSDPARLASQSNWRNEGSQANGAFLAQRRANYSLGVGRFQRACLRRAHVSRERRCLACRLYVLQRRWPTLSHTRHPSAATRALKVTPAGSRSQDWRPKLSPPSVNPPPSTKTSRPPLG